MTKRFPFCVLCLWVISGCSSTLHMKSGLELDVDIVASSQDTVWVMPVNEDRRPFIAEGLIAIDSYYKGIAIAVPRERIEDISNISGVVGGVFSGIGTIGMGLIGVAFAKPNLTDRGVYHFSGVVISLTGYTVGLPYLFEWADAKLGGSRNLRLAAGISGLAMMVLTPAFIPVVCDHIDERSAGYYTLLVPTAMSAGLSLMIWGWDRYIDSKSKNIVEDYFVTPVLVPARDGSLNPGVGITMAW